MSVYELFLPTRVRVSFDFSHRDADLPLLTFPLHGHDYVSPKRFSYPRTPSLAFSLQLLKGHRASLLLQQRLTHVGRLLSKRVVTV